ncbi:thioredoxin domain-containing protein [Streptomyces palmae]|uniref:DsbA family protein n=1 Tax=Streptomyces palmae TaxID=1701085 RepID=A0A4Z0HD55_9ACTN|nr:thioredoxin domain-containing protein [Streptomyces palmae]TGB16408.1 DsbA family protein [Streptomyces palmae]
MSNRNSQANKQAARERLRAERERQAKKDKMRRQLTMGGAIVAVLAIAGGVGFAISNSTSGSKNSKVSNKEWKTAADKTKYVAPANTTGDKGTTILIGDKKAKNTLTVFEDMRCPICAQFEQGLGDTVAKDLKDGKFKAEFKIVAFIDDNKQISGSGSKNALSALGAALNVSPDAFLEYKKALYAEKNHPEETDDAFSDDKLLIKIANEVPELKGNKAFEKDVRGGTYDKWAIAMNKEFDKAVEKGITGTPGFLMNGEKVSLGGLKPEDFHAMIQPAMKK